MKRRNMKGFTLVELLIVLLILGILIGLAVPRYLQAVEKSKERTFCSNIRSIYSAIETWRMDTGTSMYPSVNTLNSSIIQSKDYFSQPPRNPWTNGVITATTASPNTKGDFYYDTANNGASYTASTNPDCTTIGGGTQ